MLPSVQTPEMRMRGATLLRVLHNKLCTPGLAGGDSVKDAMAFANFPSCPAVEAPVRVPASPTCPPDSA